MMAPVGMLLLLGALAWTVADNQASAIALANGMASSWQVGAKVQQPTLVIYVYSPTDPGELLSNTARCTPAHFEANVIIHVCMFRIR